jgi:hypothetical protein
MAMLHDLEEPPAIRALPGIRPAAGLEVRVVHPDTHARCKPDEEGVPRRVVTPGGRVGFRGRLKETLRISHHMVAPGQIEAFLLGHPDVAQAFVVGVTTCPAPRAHTARRCSA